MKVWLSLLLAIIHGVAGLSILMVSSWFIAACAIAPISFNYMLPAVVIRGLALLRIGSGYAHMWLAHHHLLSLTRRLRLDLFAELHHSRLEAQADGVEALARYTEDIAALWVGWVAHQTAAIFMLLGALGAAWWIGLPATQWLIALTLSWLLLNAILCWYGLKVASKELNASHAFRYHSQHYLSSASLWHLYRGQGAHIDRPKGSQYWLWRAKHSLGGQMGSWVLQGASYSLLLLLLVNDEQLIVGSALMLVVPMMLLSSHDWLGRSLQSHEVFARYREGKVALQNIDWHPVPVVRTPERFSQLSMVEFGPHTLPFLCITKELSARGLCLLKGDSGSGKSQLLQALAGHIQSHGERLLDGQAFSEGLWANSFYVEQTPIILNATVRGNLDVAASGFSDAQMRATLDEFGLQSLANLDEWLGTGGRILSGGESKRFALARAYLQHPAIVLVDEPFEGLDRDNIHQVAALLRGMSERALVIVASHVVPFDVSWDETIDLS